MGGSHDPASPGSTLMMR